MSSQKCQHQFGGSLRLVEHKMVTGPGNFRTFEVWAALFDLL